MGTSQKSLCHAHYILDSNPNALITIYTEDAEAGFTENPNEAIILKDILAKISSQWYGYIPDSVEYDKLSSTSSSWLVKALAIRLAERGGQFILHTRISEIDEINQQISFRGGGMVASGTNQYDELYDFR